MKDLINTINDDEYFQFLNEIKKDIINTRKTNYREYSKSIYHKRVYKRR